MGSGSGVSGGGVFQRKIRERGKGWGGWGVGTAKEPGGSMRKLCRNYPLANYPLVSSRLFVPRTFCPICEDLLSSSLMESLAKVFFAESLQKFCGKQKFAQEVRLIASGKGAEILHKVCGTFADMRGTFSAMTPSHHRPLNGPF